MVVLKLKVGTRNWSILPHKTAYVWTLAPLAEVEHLNENCVLMI